MYKTNINNLNKAQIDDDWEKFLNGNDSDSDNESGSYENDCDDLYVDEFCGNEIVSDNLSIGNTVFRLTLTNPDKGLVTTANVATDVTEITKPTIITISI